MSPKPMRLSGEDAGFLYMDLPGQPMNTMAVGVLAPAEHGPVTLADLAGHLERQLPQLPSFRWRIVPVPLGLHHPVAVDDPDFDLDFHLRHEQVDAPGGDKQLESLFARIAERHLDPRHPLWQATLVDGLADGRQAVILKYHHCLADGVAALTTFSRVFSDEPRPPLQGVAPYSPAPIPRRTSLVAGALADHLRTAARLPALIRRTRLSTKAVKDRRATAPHRVPDFSGQAPRTPLNDAFTPGRAYVRVDLSLSGLKDIKDAAEVTLNDVVLAVLSGACRRYLNLLDALPERPLLTSVPVADEPVDAHERQFGNRFWSFTTSLATNIEDPWERLAVISAVTSEAKHQLGLLGVDLMPDWLDVVPPLVARPGARALVERLRSTDGDVDANILISNIRGPQQRWQLLGREVERLHVDGPPSNGVGLNVMLWSYGDQMLLGILAFADALHRPDLFATAVTDSFAELNTLARNRTSTVEAGASPRSS